MPSDGVTMSSWPRTTSWRRHRLEQLAGQMGGAVLVGTRLQHKLIAPMRATVSCSRTCSCMRRATATREFIAHAVPQRIVDVLEMVQIHEQHRQRLRWRLNHADIVRKAVGQQGAVGQPGEQVEMRHPADALLVGLALAHVRENADVMRGLPLGVLDALTVSHWGYTSPFLRRFQISPPQAVSWMWRQS